MITTAAADTLAGLFTGAPASGDPAVASGVAFGKVLSASADMPVAPMTPLISRTMPGIATLPIGTLMGAGSLPFQASNLPSTLVWSGASVPVTTGGTMPSASQPMAISPPTLASMPIKSATLPAAVTEGSLNAVLPASEVAERRLPVIDSPSLPVAKDTPKAAISVRTAPVVEAPLSEVVTLNLPASVPAEPEAASPTPTIDGSEAPPPSTPIGKVERPTAAPARIAEPLNPLSLDTLTTSPVDPEITAPSETAAPASGKGNAKRAETKQKAPETLVATSFDPLAMLTPAPVLAAMPSAPSGKPIIGSESDDDASSDDDRSDSIDRNPVEGSRSSSGAVPLPAETVGAPIKTVAVAAERQAGATTPSAHPAVVPPPQTDAASLAAIDTGTTAASNAAPSTPHIGSAVPEEGRVAETGAAKTQSASFTNLVAHTETTAAPARVATAPTPSPEPHVTAQPGRMGQEMGVAIARHAATGGGEAMTVRLDPVEFGRIEVTLSFDDSGTIRAVVAAESPAALDLLRRDSADLGRSLAEAGIRSDAQSFRFDTRQGSADGSGQGGQRWQQQSATGTRTAAQATDDIPEPVYRPLRTQGRVDLMA